MNGILENKVALITGAGSGIAAAAARLFHKEGARIVLADVSGKEADLAAELGERVVSCHAGVSKSQDVQAMIDMAITHFGQLDILCNVAGITGPQGSLEDAREEDFDAVIAVNIRGLFLSMKYALPHLVRDGGGVIVNISSATALVGMPGLAVYSATKGAIIATTRVIAAEYASKGVRANVICPGGIETDLSGAPRPGPGVGQQDRQPRPRRPGRQARGDRPGDAVPRVRRIVLHDRRGRSRRRWPDGGLKNGENL